MNADRFTLQLITNSLRYASEEMGLALRNSAYSPNIKERMDHSAAVFYPEGRLLAQAEHIPVHLGSLPWGLNNLLERCRLDGLDLSEGSMIVSNNPYITGTHLNDVTVASPIHHRGRLVGFAVNKAHHSDVGGRVPGSISMESRTLSDEGFVLDLAYLTKNGEFVEKTVENFSSASRTPFERKGDLKAQKAANITGTRRVVDTISRYGLETFRIACRESFSQSESMMRRRISLIPSGTYSASEILEGARGAELILRVKVRISGRSVEVDYTGTDPEVDYPLNAVFGVTLSGAFFVLRTLTGDDIPANHGAFAPVTVVAPSGTLLNPTYPHPVGGGNVETSQRNADLVYRAMCGALPDIVPAAPGGSMNNIMIGGGRGSRRWAFYETIGVGLGGRKQADGIDGIQCNMTNTMNTPIEEIERSLPLMITRYEFRAGSSGAGRRRGGVGVVRRYRALSAHTILTVLADREFHSPWGVRGGRDGKTTEAVVERLGKEVRVPCKSTLAMNASDEFEIRTAGGGGYGDPARRSVSDIRRDTANGLT